MTAELTLNNVHALEEEKHDSEVDEENNITNIEDDYKIREFLKQVDGKYYHHKIENRLSELRRFPLLGEDGKLFVNAYQYVNIRLPKTKK